MSNKFKIWETIDEKNLTPYLSLAPDRQLYIRKNLDHRIEELQKIIKKTFYRKTWRQVMWNNAKLVVLSFYDITRQDLKGHEVKLNDRSSCWKSRKKWCFGEFFVRTVAHGRKGLASHKASYKWRINKFAFSWPKWSVELLEKVDINVVLKIFFTERSRTVAQF